MAERISETRRLLAMAGLPLALMAAKSAQAAKFFQPSNIRPAKMPDAETAALLHLRKQNFEQAMEALEAGVERELRREKPSLRLLDLLSTLYARRGRLEDLAALSDRVQAAGRAAAMLERAAKWRDGHSKWRCDRANPEAIIRWRNVRRDDIVIPA